MTIERCDNCKQFDLKKVFTDMKERVEVPEKPSAEAPQAPTSQHPGEAPAHPGEAPAHPGEAPAQPEAPANPDLVSIKSKYAAIAGKHFLNPERLLYGSLNKHPDYFEDHGEKHETGYLVRTFDSHGKPLGAYSEMHDQNGKVVSYQKVEPGDGGSVNDLKTSQNTVQYHASFGERAAFGDVHDFAPDHTLAQSMM